jgi:hypothetical protein
MFSEEDVEVAMLLEFIADFGTEPKTEAMIEVSPSCLLSTG